MFFVAIGQCKGRLILISLPCKIKVMMGVKETLAFLSESGTVCPVLMTRLAEQGYRVLLVSNDTMKMDSMLEDLNLQDLPGEIELTHCAKDGCWEADIIALVDPEEFDAEMVNRIKDVATQKILLCIETEESLKSCFSKTQLEELQASFPYSKLVYIKINAQQMSAELHGKDKEAREIISRIFKSPGYEIQQMTDNQ